MQRKKKRSIIFELYSIPIKIRSLWTNTQKYFRKNSLGISKRLYLVSYSIPLSCMVVLLLGLFMMINPSSNELLAQKTNALEIDGDSDFENSISPQAADDPLGAGITFSIGGAGQSEVVETAVDTVAYRSHTVQIIISNAEDYYLMISGQPSLSLSDGTKSLSGISGSNVIGANMKAGEWGYSWDQTNTQADASMAYKAVPSAQTRLSVPSLTNNATNFTGKLNFAAKFPDNATLGNYSSNVNLTLVVTPKANTGKASWYDETGKETTYEVGTGTMQGISEVDHGADGGFCKGNDKIGIGWATELVDNRDGKTYTVYKAADGNCWMGQNLALNATSADGLLLTPADSDLITSWTLPASVDPNNTSGDVPTSWDGENYNLAQIRTGSIDFSSNWKEGYGNYYSWTAATAGTGTSSVTDTTHISSICPKGWKLPAYSGDYSFKNLITAKTSWTNTEYNGISGIAGYYLGLSTNLAANAQVHNKASFWPAAGYAYYSTLKNPSTEGKYWSRTSYDDHRFAYHLAFTSSSVAVDANGSGALSLGLPIRCVANEDNGRWMDNAGSLRAEDTGLRTMQDITSENFTGKYCSSTKNSIVSVGATLKLRDTRDDNVYTIYKAADGRCWMGTNLKLGRNSSAIRLTPNDTDITSNYTLPRSSSSWSSGDPTAGYVLCNYIGGDDCYYTYNSATASTGASLRSGDAPGSICPKGWRLPTSDEQSILTNTKRDWDSKINGRYFGSTAINLVNNANFWPSVGVFNVNLNHLNGLTSGGGYYRSSSAYDGNYAYVMYFSATSSDVYQTHAYLNYSGCSIRCTAR